jgi:NAD(P)-dependent dehydrogenase (short-subunit alcohol dehydrogenase family)
MMTQRSAPEGVSARAELDRRFPGRVGFEPADIRSPAAVETVVRTAVDAYGSIDILCNNAGIGLVRAAHETTDEEYDTVLDTNLRGIFLTCRSAVPHMVKQQSGSIINVGSVAGWVGFAQDAVYCASKGAVLALTRQMALDYAPYGIRVNCVCPGFVDTEMMRVFIASHADPGEIEREIVGMHPIGRVGQPREIAAAVAFLASRDASFITGESLAVDGGLLAR